MTCNVSLEYEKSEAAKEQKTRSLWFSEALRLGFGRSRLVKVNAGFFYSSSEQREKLVERPCHALDVYSLSEATRRPSVAASV